MASSPHKTWKHPRLRMAHDQIKDLASEMREYAGVGLLDDILEDLETADFHLEEEA